MLPLIRYRHRPVQILEQHPGAGSSLGEGAIATDTGVQNVLQCATRHYRHRVGAEDSQTPVRNSDPMAVESRGDLASRHGSIGRIAVAHSWSFRSDNPICNTTPPQETLEIRPQAGRPTTPDRSPGGSRREPLIPLIGRVKIRVAILAGHGSNRTVPEPGVQLRLGSPVPRPASLVHGSLPDRPAARPPVSSTPARTVARVGCAPRARRRRRHYQRCCMDRGGDGIRPFPSGSVRRCVRTQAVRVRSLCSELSGRP